MLSNLISLKQWTGPALVGLAAFLWATDALVRYPAIGKVDPTLIVLVEHILAVIILLPWVIRKHRDEIFALSPKEWLSALFCGVGGSAVATLFFTASFLFINPSVAVLLQKLQPVMVVVIAYLFLGERPAKKFYFWGLIALAAGIVLSFPDLDFKFLSEGVDLHSKGIKYAFGAALIWAASTVSGKILLKRTAPTLATFWRFCFGLFGLMVLLGLSGNLQIFEVLNSFENILVLLYLSLIPGLFAMMVYYAGLARTPASVTTFIELLYPIGAVILNTMFLHTPLQPVQVAAGSVLILAVAVLSF